MNRPRTGIILVFSAVFIFCNLVGYAEGSELRRVASDYHILAQTRARLKGYKLEGGTCNVGVNRCSGRASERLHATAPQLALGTQIVGDRLSIRVGSGATLGEVFCNDCGLNGASVLNPGSVSDPNYPAQSFSCPILSDASYEALVAACDGLGGEGFPAVFLSGDLDVMVPSGGGDCQFVCRGSSCPSVADSDLGNGVCDLPGGVYGDVKVRNGGKLSFDGGQYHVASYQNGRNVVINTKQVTTLNVKEGRPLRLGDGAVTLVDCGMLRVNFEGGRTRRSTVSYGKRSNIVIDLCAPFALVRLGNSNVIGGHQFADVILSDAGNEGRCCPVTAPATPTPPGETPTPGPSVSPTPTPPGETPTPGPSVSPTPTPPGETPTPGPSVSPTPTPPGETPTPGPSVSPTPTPPGETPTPPGETPTPVPSASPTPPGETPSPTPTPGPCDTRSCLWGDDPSQQFGNSLARLGDVDGDGVGDFAIGSPKADVKAGVAVLQNAGIVQVFSGATLEEIARLEGTEADARFGRSIADMGDLNGDGDPEIAVGSQRTDITIPPPDPFSPGRFSEDAGTVFLASVLSGNVIWRFDGSRRGDWLGDAVAAVGDLDADGIPDLVAAAPGGGPRDAGEGFDYGGGPGEAFAISGLTGTEIYHFLGEKTGDGFGAALAGWSDLTGDGIPEVIVSDGTTRGSLFFFSGADGSLWARIKGGPASDGLGRSVLILPDSDGDGVEEVLAGAPDVSTEFAAAGGRVVLYSGATLVETYHRDEPWVRGGFALGRALALAPDLDGDGFLDFVGGAPGANKKRTGSLFIFSGLDGMVIGKMIGLAQDDQLGWRLETIGDINGDGREDMLIYASGSRVVYVATSTDSDGDGAWDYFDNCEGVDNPGQWDEDADGIGDACDTCTDVDGDGFADQVTPITTCPEDNCPGISNPDQNDEDSDGDGVIDACDNCMIIFNPDQEFDESCKPIGGRVRITAKKRLGINTFSISMSGIRFDESAVEQATTNKFEVEILDEDGTSLFGGQVNAGEILRLKPGQGRFRAAFPNSIELVTIKVGSKGKLSIRVRGSGALTPVGVPAARLHFGSIRLATSGKR